MNASNPLLFPEVLLASARRSTERPRPVSQTQSGVTPHGRGLHDLAGQVEVAWASSPSEARRNAFASRFDFPLCDRLETVLDDSLAIVVVC